MLEVSTHLLTHPRFIRYPQSMKDEMVSDAVLKIIRNLKNMKEEYKDSFFNYFTRTAFTAYVTYLGKHYKEMNHRRELLIDALESVKGELPLNQHTNDTIRELERLLKDLEPDHKTSADEMDID